MMSKKLFLILSCVALCFAGCKQKNADSENQQTAESEVVMDETNMILCQSCGMPLSEDVFGTNADGSVNQEYCKYCFADGKMLNPDLTMDEMIEVCVPYMVEQGISKDDATTMMKTLLPTLKRWKTAEL